MLAAVLIAGGAALILAPHHPVASARRLPALPARPAPTGGPQPAIATDAGPFDAGPVSLHGSCGIKLGIGVGVSINHSKTASNNFCRPADCHECERSPPRKQRLPKAADRYRD